MATKEELKLMVKQFRVAELQSLLEFAGDRNTRLRKKELQKKALQLVTRKRTVILAHKVRVIYRSMRGVDVDEDFLSDLEDDTDLDYEPEEPMNKYGILASYTSSRSAKYYNSPLSSTANPQNYYNTPRPTTRQSFSTLTKNIDMHRLSFVRFTKLTFYNHESDMMFLTPLIPRKQDGDVFLFDTTFELSYSARNILFCENSRHHALLRFCVLNNETEVNDYLPAMLSVSVNDNYCTLPPVGPATTKKGSVCQFGAPINITQYLEKNKFYNAISLQWSADFYTPYGVVVQLVQKYTADELIAKLKEKGEQDPAISKKLIYQNLNDQDNEIAATSLKMSLTCPLGKMLMSLPTRASTCNHLQCFDGCLYIKMNEVKSLWQCPVCNQPCLYENLFVDGYFMDILRSDRFTPSITNIQINADGSWESATPQEKPKSRPKSSPVKVPEVSEKAPTLDLCSQPERDIVFGQNILDDLQRFFKNLSEISSHRSSFPELCEDTHAVDNIFNVKPINDAELSELSTNSNEEPPPKKNVILVDLTESDSESDEIQSISTISGTPSASPLLLKNNGPRSSSPPVYDIDSDSSSL